MAAAAGGGPPGKIAVVGDLTIPVDRVGVVIAAHPIAQGVERPAVLHEEVHDLPAVQEGLPLQDGGGGGGGQGVGEGIPVPRVPGELDGLVIVLGDLLHRGHLVGGDLIEVAAHLAEGSRVLEHLVQIAALLQLVFL